MEVGEIYDGCRCWLCRVQLRNFSYVQLSIHILIPALGAVSRMPANFMGFLDKMGVETEPSRMTLGVSRDHGSFGWAGSSLGAMFSRKRNVLSPKLWRMVFDIARFNHFALDLLMGEDDDTRSNGLGMVNHVGKASTIGEYLADEGYSDTFRDDYLLPMIAALWRITVDKSALEFPAEELVRSL